MLRAYLFKSEIDIDDCNLLSLTNKLNWKFRLTLNQAAFSQKSYKLNRF